MSITASQEYRPSFITKILSPISSASFGLHRYALLLVFTLYHEAMSKLAWKNDGNIYIIWQG